MTKTIYKNDSLKVRVTVVDSNNLGYDLTGATLACRFGQIGSPGVAGTTTAINAAQGVVDIFFPAGSGNIGSNTAQLLVTNAGETQTVYSETFLVKPSVSLT